MALILRTGLLCAALLFAHSAAADEAATGPANEHLQPMAFLAGACWRGEFPGGHATDRHCFQWVYGGQHLRDTHVVRGKNAPYKGETIYSWDAENQRIAFRYWNSLGGFSDGHFEVVDGVLTAPERYVGDDGEIIEMRSTLVAEDDDHYLTRTLRQIEGEWHEDWTIRFERDGQSP